MAGGHDYIQEGSAVNVTTNPVTLKEIEINESVTFSVEANVVDNKICDNCKGAVAPDPLYQWQENRGVSLYISSKVVPFKKASLIFNNL